MKKMTAQVTMQPEPSDNLWWLWANGKSRA